MAQYSIGQVEKITGVKQHVLRYWEETVPGFAHGKIIPAEEFIPSVM